LTSDGGRQRGEMPYHGPRPSPWAARSPVGRSTRGRSRWWSCSVAGTCTRCAGRGGWPSGAWPARSGS